MDYASVKMKDENRSMWCATNRRQTSKTCSTYLLINKSYTEYKTDNWKKKNNNNDKSTKLCTTFIQSNLSYVVHSMHRCNRISLCGADYNNTTYQTVQELQAVFAEP